MDMFYRMNKFLIGAYVVYRSERTFIASDHNQEMASDDSISGRMAITAVTVS